MRRGNGIVLWCKSECEEHDRPTQHGNVVIDNRQKITVECAPTSIDSPWTLICIPVDIDKGFSIIDRNRILQMHNCGGQLVNIYSLWQLSCCNHAGVDLTRYNGPDASGLTDITHRRSLADAIVGPAHHDNADWQRLAKSMPVTIKRLESFLADNRAVSNKRTVPLV
ncbi:putative LRR receptor-like serine/threonine-protein kinase [Trichinella pseudospiralis]